MTSLNNNGGTETIVSKSYEKTIFKNLFIFVDNGECKAGWTVTTDSDILASGALLQNPLSQLNWLFLQIYVN